MEKQIVKFVVDKELDIANHFIALNSYKRNREKGFQQYKNDFLEKLSVLTSEDEIRNEIEKYIEIYYKQENKLISLVEDINEEWAKIEKDFIQKLEEVHKFPFPHTEMRGVLSSASRFGYNTHEGWFATDMMKNKFCAIDVATHELMHFMFHRYYDKICEEKELSKNEMWDVKESFTVLLNIEFSDFRLQQDFGYPPHAKLREIIKESWEKDRDFDKVLDRAIEYVKTHEAIN